MRLAAVLARVARESQVLIFLSRVAAVLCTVTVSATEVIPPEATGLSRTLCLV
jgi:hypothetical protein